MKKIVGTIAAAALIASAAFADVTFGEWGRAGLNFGLTDTTTSETKTTVAGTTTTVSTDSNGAPLTTFRPGWGKIGLGIHGNADDVCGFDVDFNICNWAGPAIGDVARFWVNFGWAKVQFGKIQVDDLRGSNGDWGEEDMFNKIGEDVFFKRFEPSAGMTLSVTPIDGLFLGAALNTSTAGVFTYDNLFQNGQYGVGYTIDGVAQIKAQYIGDANNVNHAVQAGAKIFAIDGMTIEVGGKVYLANEDQLAGTEQQWNYLVAGVSGSADALSYMVAVEADFAKKRGAIEGYKTETELGLKADADVKFAFDSFAVGCTVGYAGEFYTAKPGKIDASAAKNDIGVELFVEKPLPGGYIFAGVADNVVISTASAKGDGYEMTKSTVTNKLSIPVGVQLGF